MPQEDLTLKLSKFDLVIRLDKCRQLIFNQRTGVADLIDLQAFDTEGSGKDECLVSLISHDALEYLRLRGHVTNEGDVEDLASLEKHVPSYLKMAEASVRHDVVVTYD